MFVDTMAALPFRNEGHRLRSPLSMEVRLLRMPQTVSSRNRRTNAFGGLSLRTWHSLQMKHFEISTQIELFFKSCLLNLLSADSLDRPAGPNGQVDDNYQLNCILI